MVSVGAAACLHKVLPTVQTLSGLQILFSVVVVGTAVWKGVPWTHLAVALQFGAA